MSFLVIRSKVAKLVSNFIFVVLTLCMNSSNKLQWLCRCSPLMQVGIPHVAQRHCFCMFLCSLCIVGTCSMSACMACTHCVRLVLYTTAFRGVLLLCRVILVIVFLIFLNTVIANSLPLSLSHSFIDQSPTTQLTLFARCHAKQHYVTFDG